jgi:hypothetical protein
MAAMIFKVPPTMGTVFHVDIERPFEQPFELEY